MLPSRPEDGLNTSVFPLAILLVKGKRLALALLYLGSLFYRLNECLKNIVWSVEHYNVVTYTDIEFIQMFIRETF